MKIDVFELRDDRSYSRDHVWVKAGDDAVTVGMDDFSQKMLEFIDAIELPEPGTRLDVGSQLLALNVTRRICEGGLCTIERGRSVVLSPVAGVVSEVNTALASTPELMQMEPYDGGWVAVVEPSEDSASVSGLMEAGDMEVVLTEEIADQPSEIMDRVRAAWA